MEELKVSLENIIPLTYARDHFSQIVGEVQKDKLFILTKGGVPAVAIMDVKYLETITGGGIKKEEIQEEIKKVPEQVGLPKMVEHPSPPPRTEFSDKDSGPVPSPTPPLAPTQPAAIPPPPPAKTPPPSPKPAGFAAPSPPSPVPPTPGPKPTPPPPPSSSKTFDEPKPFSTPEPPTPPPPGPPPAGPTGPGKPQGALTMPSGISTAPSSKDKDQAKVDIQFSPDETVLKEKTEKDKKTKQELASPDDKNPPAQFAGAKEGEVEDMAID